MSVISYCKDECIMQSNNVMVVVVGGGAADLKSKSWLCVGYKPQIPFKKHI